MGKQNDSNTARGSTYTNRTKFAHIEVMHSARSKADITKSKPQQDSSVTQKNPPPKIN